MLRGARLADQDGPGVLLNELLQDESKLNKNPVYYGWVDILDKNVICI